MNPKILYPLALSLLIFFTVGCSSSKKSSSSVSDGKIRSTVTLKGKVPAVTIQSKNVKADELVSFAETLKGISYRFGGKSPKEGFDCSGFTWYVFNRFNIKVPRRSVDFTNAGKEISIEESRRGDLILFTGSNPKSGEVGHMGIITENKGNRLRFIHSASGGNKGVMVSGMSDYFITRFVKVIRVFSVF